MTFRAAATLRKCSRCWPNLRSQTCPKSPIRTTALRHSASTQHRYITRSAPLESQDRTPEAQHRPDPKTLDVEEDAEDDADAAEILRSYLGQPMPKESEDDLVDVQAPDVPDADTQDALGSEDVEETDRYRGFEDAIMTQPDIGMDALGQPIGALMLRNPNRVRKTRTYDNLPLLERDEPITPFEIEDTIEAGKDDEPLTQEELFRNIEEQRPADSRVVSRYEYGKILRALVDGFTWTQLSSYKKANTTAARKSITSSPYEWIHLQAPWASHAPADMTDMATGGAKLAVAWNIVHRLWGLAIRDQVDTVGQTTIFLKPEVAWLFSRPDSPVLQMIRRDYLDDTNGEKVHEFYSSIKKKPALYLESKRSTMTAVLEKLDSVIKSIVSRSIEGYSHVLSKDVFPASALELLGQLTDTKIELHGSAAERTMKVYWVPSPTRPAPVELRSAATTHEDPADIAFRLLLNARDDHARPASEISIYRPSETDVPSAVPDMRESRGKPITHQFVKNYSRACTSTPRSSNVPTVENPFNDPTQTEALLDLVDSNKKGNTSRVYATFGHVLEIDGENEKESATLEGSQSGWGTLRGKRHFVPLVPHPASLTGITADVDDKKIKRKTEILLNFRPDPAEKDSRSLPVQVTIPIDHLEDVEVIKIPENVKIETINSQRRDMCFSNAPVDVRLVINQRWQLQRTPEVRDFFSACTINLSEGFIGIPSRAIFQAPPTKRQWSGTKSSYIYSGLEIHQSVEMEWNGQTLRYNSIEGGLAGGQRQEIVLEADMKASDAATAIVDRRVMRQEVREELSQKLQNLLGLVTEVVSGRHISFTNGKAKLGTWQPRRPKRQAIKDLGKPDAPVTPQDTASERPDTATQTTNEADDGGDDKLDNLLRSLGIESTISPSNSTPLAVPNASGPPANEPRFDLRELEASLEDEMLAEQSKAQQSAAGLLPQQPPASPSGRRKASSSRTQSRRYSEPSSAPPDGSANSSTSDPDPDHDHDDVSSQMAAQRVGENTPPKSQPQRRAPRRGRKQAPRRKTTKTPGPDPSDPFSALSSERRE